MDIKQQLHREINIKRYDIKGFKQTSKIKINEQKMLRKYKSFSNII